mmetsp:Transcript_26109/g.60866  ORF Transcript_26109/g.60866 Transcript_26109/m.60866 type:complete len:544 (-) Transcript_26109:63-1694(-)
MELDGAPDVQPDLEQLATMRQAMRVLMEQHLQEYEHLFCYHVKPSTGGCNTPVRGHSTEDFGHLDGFEGQCSWHTRATWGEEYSSAKSSRISRKGTHIATEIWDELWEQHCDPNMPLWLHQLLSGWRSKFAMLKEPTRHGMLAEILQSKRFEMLCVLIITINAGFIIAGAAACPDRTAELVSEAVFTSFYMCEVFMRLWVHRLFYFCNVDWAWNILDFIVVSLSVFDLFLASFVNSSSIDLHFLRTLRIVKALKLFRVFRVLRFSRELRLMLDCLTGCFASLGWSLVMLGFVLCLTSLYFVQSISLQSESDDHVEPLLQQAFSSVHTGMLSLFKAVTGGKDWGFYLDLFWADDFNLDGCIFLGFIIFFMVAILNIVTSMFLDRVVSNMRPTVYERLSARQKADQEDAAELREHFSEMAQGTGAVHREQFVLALTQQKFLQRYLLVWGLCVDDANLFFDMVTAGSNRPDVVDLDTLVKACLRLKGGADSLALHGLVFYHKQMQDLCEERFDEILSVLRSFPLGCRKQVSWPADGSLPVEGLCAL